MRAINWPRLWGGILAIGFSAGVWACLALAFQ